MNQNKNSNAIGLLLIAVGLTLAFGSGRALAQRPLGVDVYSGNGSITWSSVYNAGYKFTWAKASEGSGFTDTQFVNNAVNAQNAGVLFGAYHYARYDLNLGLAGATNEANWFWSVAGPYIKANGGYLTPFLDVEADGSSYTKTTLSQWVVTWCNIISNNAYAQGVVIQPMVYTYPSYASTYLDSTVTPFTLDMATVSPAQNPQTGAPSCSGPWGCNWTVWQYSWTNVVPGIPGVSGDTDADVYNGTYNAMIGQLCPRPRHPNIDSYCGNEQNGNAQIFLPDAVNNMESLLQNCPNCSWGAWLGSGGPTCFGTPPVVGYNADLRMQVFVLGADNNVWTQSQTSVNGGWGSWSNYAGNVRGNVTVGYLSNGAMQIFARSSSNTVVTMNQTGPNAGWTAWSDLGGSCYADPVVGFNADGRMQLFCQTSSNTMQSNFKTTGGTWFGWVDYGGNCYGKPAVANLENGVIQVFTRTSSNTVHTINQTSANGTWGGWTDLGGNCATNPVMGYNADGRIQLFVQTSANTVSTDYKTTTGSSSAWSGWSSLGGSCFYDLAAGYNADGRIQLFMRDSNYNVQSTWQTTVASASWSSYLNMAGNTPAVSILTQPTNRTVAPGQSTTFTVAATNALGYQWLFNGSNISGATASSYTLNNAQSNNQGGYSVTLTNWAGMTTSSNALLVVTIPLTITNQPQSLEVGQGNNATFSVGVSGDAPIGYQWRFNTTNIALATNASYTVTNARLTNQGNYSVVVTNVGGLVTSSNAVLTVDAPPAITVQPLNKTVIQGHLTAIAVTANGSPTLSYQWQLGGSNVAGATASSYILTSAQPNQAGNYQAIITNSYGSVTSSVATVTVLSVPAITGQPQSQSVSAGSNATFSVSATGGNLSYQWLFNTGTIGGATNSSYTVSNAQTNNGGNYSVVVTNTQGSVTSSNALLTVNAVIQAPQFQSVTVLPNGVVQMVLSGQAGSTYAIDGSSNLVDWVPLTNFLNTNGTYQFTDTSSTNQIQGFYRGRLVP